MSTIRSVGITSGTAPGQVDVEALADLIRHKSVELAEVAALFAEHAARGEAPNGRSPSGDPHS